MADTEEDWIRKRAYALWQEEGSPHGKDAEHWEQARREYAAFALTPARRGSAKRAENSALAPAPSIPDAGKKTRPKKLPTSGSAEKSPGKASAVRRSKKASDDG
ncbi:DUF2934 domain-containing protein [Rhizobium halophilum]|uniref:DUF2934 domain-containing protein n=1 Tax=Rhizobium halophilum TaxID=2846852 RepID=UPI001EFEAC01|nr:DUF2934 domain-containing protein [Rhizobium halophilum]MCF6367956.1 DUF2934 domain-containing protein [Rhizobium halophilum]